MEPSMLYEIYSNAKDSGIATVIGEFWSTCREYPLTGIFYIWLLFKKPSKTVDAFIKHFI